MKEVVLPNIIDKRNPPIEGKKISPRTNVHPIVFNPRNGKYLALKWKKFDWTTFPMGGVDEGEDIVEAAKREVRSETGFHNLKLIKVLPGRVRAEYFAAHKDVNRISFTTAVMFELVDESQTETELEDHEQDAFEVTWLDASDLNYSIMTHAEIEEWGKKMDPKYSVHTDEGVLVNSGEFDELDSLTAKKLITQKYGLGVTRYKLRDWLLSRQRYWGAPIPVVYDPQGKPHAIPEKHLPWLLPEDDIDFTPKGASPLASSKELKERVEKIFGPGWTPEYDTMDTFVDSSWYFLRYTDPKNDKEFASKESMAAWLPIDRYSGGAEHTTMHLLYSRFFHKALFDMRLVKDAEPYKERMNRGLILGPDGQKMSKSKGNVIDPDEQVKKFGADTVRMYLAFIGPYNEAGQYPWDIGGIVGTRRFLEKVWKLSLTFINFKDNESSQEISSTLNKTIKKVTEDITAFKFNTAISSMMIFLNSIYKTREDLPSADLDNLDSAYGKFISSGSSISQKDFEVFLKLLAPFAPHMTEEIWSHFAKAARDKHDVEKFSKSIHLQPWPEFDESKIKEEKITISIQINGKVRGQIEVKRDADENEVKSLVLGLPEIKKWLEGKTIKRSIFIANRALSLVLE